LSLYFGPQKLITVFNSQIGGPCSGISCGYIRAPSKVKRRLDVIKFIQYFYSLKAKQKKQKNRKKYRSTHRKKSLQIQLKTSFLLELRAKQFTERTILRYR